MSSEIECLKKKINDMEIFYNNKIYELENKISNLIKNNKCIIKNIELEKFELNDNFVLKCLRKKSIKGDIEIIKKIYFDTDSIVYPIIYNKKDYIYRYNNTWINDGASAPKLTNILIRNLADCYVNINKFDKNNHNIDKFIENEEYIINTLKKPKYIKSLLDEIKDIIL